MDQKNTSYIWAYDKESRELFTDGIVINSLLEDVLSEKFNGTMIYHEQKDVVKNNIDRFVFLTRKDVEDIIVNHLTVRNPILDNVSFQKKYEFDKEPMTLAKLNFRNDLLTEEFNETQDAFKNKDPEEFVDGLIDLIVIALGTLHLVGVSANNAWTQVYNANMSKVRGIKPGREQSGGFDVIKPEGWKGPNHSNNHGKLAEIFAES